MDFYYKDKLCYERYNPKKKIWKLDELVSDNDVKNIITKYKIKKNKKDICTQLEKLEKEKAPKKKPIRKKLIVKNNNSSDDETNTDSDSEKEEEKHLDLDNCEKYKVKELKDILLKLKLPVSGTKAVLCKKLRTYYKKDNKKDNKEDDKEKEDLDLDNCEKYKVKELKEFLLKLKLPVSGTKSILCKRLKTHYNKDNKDNKEEEKEEENIHGGNILFQKCQVYGKCPKGYSRENLVNLANECGVNIKKQKGNMNMKEICDNMKDKYGYKYEIKDDKDEIKDKKGEIKKGEKLSDLINYLNSNKLEKKYLKSDLDDMLDIVINDNIDDIETLDKIQKTLLHLYESNIDDELIERYYSFFGFDIKDLNNPLDSNFNKKRICKNASTFITLTDIEDIEPTKYIKLKNGYCYDIDELVEAMIMSKDENINPSDITRKSLIWQNAEEWKKIIYHPGLDPDLFSRYEKMLEENKREENRLLTEIDENILNKIAEAGFKCLNDHISSFDVDNPELFIASQKILENLRDYINNSSKKFFYENMSIGPLRLGNVINSAHIECIHGIGGKLLTIYCNWYDKINKSKKIKLSPYVMILPEGPKGPEYPMYYFTAGLAYDNDEKPTYIKAFMIKLIEVNSSFMKNIGDYISYSYNKLVLPRDLNIYKINKNYDTTPTHLNILEKYKKELIMYFNQFINI